MAALPDVYVARLAGTFELDDGSNVNIDDEITLECKVVVREVTLRNTRDGSLCMAFVCKPVGVRVVPQAPTEMLLPAWHLKTEPEPEPEPSERPTQQLPDGPPQGTRISAVQERSNVAGSSQVERDPVLARFLNEPGEQ